MLPKAKASSRETDDAAKQPFVLSSDRQVTVHQAKTHLSRLLKAVCEGGTVVIARGDQPIAKLVPIEPAGRRRPGTLKGVISIGPEFFEPLSRDELAAWEGD